MQLKIFWECEYEWLWNEWSLVAADFKGTSRHRLVRSCPSLGRQIFRARTFGPDKMSRDRPKNRNHLASLTKQFAFNLTPANNIVSTTFAQSLLALRNFRILHLGKLEKLNMSSRLLFQDRPLGMLPT